MSNDYRHGVYNTRHLESIHCRLCGLLLPVYDRGAHRECKLRAVLGGIGHLVAHEYWCAGGQSGLNDPDAGLSYRQSALLVEAWTNIVGIGDETPTDEPA